MGELSAKPTEGADCWKQSEAWQSFFELGSVIANPQVLTSLRAYEVCVVTWQSSSFIDSLLISILLCVFLVLASSAAALSITSPFTEKSFRPLAVPIVPVIATSVSIYYLVVEIAFA